MDRSRINLVSHAERAAGRRPLYRIPIDLALGCPNREPDGSGGCTFCPADGARAVQLRDTTALSDQIEQAIAFARRRYKTTRFAAYIQAYTGTFQAIAQQRESYAAILREHNFEALTIGTRPDALSDDVIALLCELNERLPVWVELGVQTSCDRTLATLNRGHDWASSRAAIQRLHAAKLQTIAHVILGLPGEGHKEMDATASALAALPVDGIKLHNLHVITGTALATSYAAAPFPLLNEHAYAEAVIRFLRRTPSTTTLHRLTTDTPSAALVAPRWSLTKGQFITYLQRSMERREVWQGDRCAPPGEHDAPNLEAATNMRLETSCDGVTTAFLEDAGHYLHPPYGAALSARERYASPTLAMTRDIPLRVLDIGFGLGLNSLELLREAAAAGRTQALTIVGIDHDRRPARQAGADPAAPFPAPPAPLPTWNRVLAQVARGETLAGPWGSLTVEWGDARYCLGRDDRRFDVIWLDGFSPTVSPELWSVEFLLLLRHQLAPGGMLLTHERSITVIGALLAARWKVHRYATDHGDGLLAANEARPTGALPEALRERALHTPGGQPLRDPALTWLPHTIIQTRQEALDKRTSVP